MKMPRRPNGSPELPTRTVRVGSEVWEAARRRATDEGVTISRVAAELVEGYALGMIDRPETCLSCGEVRR